MSLADDVLGIPNPCRVEVFVDNVATVYAIVLETERVSCVRRLRVKKMPEPSLVRHDKIVRYACPFLCFWSWPEETFRPICQLSFVSVGSIPKIERVLTACGGS